MANAQNKVEHVIGTTAALAITVVEKAESLVGNGFWKARKAAKLAGERVKRVARRLEGGT